MASSTSCLMSANGSSSSAVGRVGNARLGEKATIGGLLAESGCSSDVSIGSFLISD